MIKYFVYSLKFIRFFLISLFLIKTFPDLLLEIHPKKFILLFILALKLCVLDGKFRSFIGVLTNKVFCFSKTHPNMLIAKIVQNMSLSNLAC